MQNCEAESAFPAMAGAAVIGTYLRQHAHPSTVRASMRPRNWQRMHGRARESDTHAIGAHGCPQGTGINRSMGALCSWSVMKSPVFRRIGCCSQEPNALLERMVDAQQQQSIKGYVRL